MNDISIIDIFIALFEFIACIVLSLLTIYVSFSLLFFVVNVISARRLKGYLLQQKHFNHPYCNQLSVIVYAHNDKKAVVSLLEQLNKQNYSKANYQTHIILDNSTDNSSNILEFVGGAKIWRVGEEETLGKDMAISWVLERLISFQNVNAYVFLDVNSSIEPDFLTNINSALFAGDVLVGKTELVSENSNIITNIKSAYNKFCNDVIQTGRRFIFKGLSTAIDSNITVIKQEVFEKVRCIDFQDVNTELKYTTMLVKSGIVPKFAPNVIIYKDAAAYTSHKASVKMRLSLFFHCIPLIFTTNLKFIEHVFRLVRPNVVFVLLVLLVNFFIGFDYMITLISAKFLCLILPIAFVAFLYGVFALAKLKKHEVLSFIFYPFYRLLKIFNNIGGIKKVLSKLFAPKKSVQVLETFSVDVLVCGRQKNYECELDVIKEDNFAKAVFKLKNSKKLKKKNYTSASYLNVYDAINEIVEKVEEHGFRLRICQTCGYFCPKLNTSELKGVCHCNMNFENPEKITTKDGKLSFLWNSCERYVPKELNNVIDISTYRQ